MTSSVKKSLVIVESPSKAKTIQKYLGRDFIVKASVGHIKDLPKSKLGIEIKDGFEPLYQLIPAKSKILQELKKASEEVSVCYLATDPDREGEAIAWHIRDELKKRGKKFHRVLFNAVTKPSILAAMENPLELNQDKFQAQQARRILDRLVGYKISPLLWDKVKRGLSAGRVQSVALRLIVEQEREIKAFKSQEYWEIQGIFQKAQFKIKCRCFKINEKNPNLSSQKQTQIHVDAFKKSTWVVHSIEKKERHRKPTPPFITSKLQQEASRKLGFTAKKTMAVAQKLYEGVDLQKLGTHGLITYMRTDSVRIEPQALSQLRSYITQTYGPEFCPKEPYLYASKKAAQEAHEAIRPTSLEFKPELIQDYLEKDAYSLYCLIWNRFVASQMSPAVLDQTALDLLAQVDLEGKCLPVLFRSSFSVMKFAGFTAVYTEGKEAQSKSNDPPAEDESKEEASDQILKLPPLQIGEILQACDFIPSQHFTQPPPHYTDASLIKDLEEKGIGRPSTYASILSNLMDREYVEKRENKYYPSELGVVVTDLLIASFPDVLNLEFTAEMETKLDEIEEGKANWKKILNAFWQPFEVTLTTAKAQMKNIKTQEVFTDINCEKCHQKMVIKWGKLGSFIACSNYPECKNTQDFKKDDQGTIIIVPKEFTDKKCPKCSKPLLIKAGKFGKFLSCSDYPTCKHTEGVTLGIHCPQCAPGEIAQKKSRFGRVFFSCNQWPQCNYALWDKPVARDCPLCKSPILIEKNSKKKDSIINALAKDAFMKKSLRLSPEKLNPTPTKSLLLEV